MFINRAAAAVLSIVVLVAGAGYVGLAVAVSIKQARPGLRVAVVDAAPAGIWERDGRASAVAAAACRMLDRLGCWAEIAPHAQAITDMIVTDSRTSDPIRPVFLTFGGEVSAGEPFAHMVANTVLNGSLRPLSDATSETPITTPRTPSNAPAWGTVSRCEPIRSRFRTPGVPA